MIKENCSGGNYTNNIMEECLRQILLYQEEKEPCDLDKNKVMGIDLGVI